MDHVLKITVRGPCNEIGGNADCDGGDGVSYEPALFSVPVQGNLLVQLADLRPKADQASRPVRVFTNYGEATTQSGAGKANGSGATGTTRAFDPAVVRHLAAPVRVPIVQSGGGFAVWASTASGVFRPNATLGFERLYRGAACFYVPPASVSTSQLCLQTVVSRCLGTVGQWEEQLRPTVNAGFNAVHFTPILARGESNSSYSQLSHVVVARQFFEPPVPPAERIVAVKQVLDRLANDHQLLCVGDLVLNHAAVNAPFLMAHGPDAAFSPCNTPELAAAVAVDQAIGDLSRALEAENVVLRAPEDVQRAVDRLQREFLVAHRLWEFYIVDVDLAARQLAPLLADGSNGEQHGAMDDAELKEWVARLDSLFLVKEPAGTGGGGRFPWSVSRGAVTQFVETRGARIGRRAHLLTALNTWNMPRYHEYDDDVVCICANVRDTANYSRFDPTGPRLGVEVRCAEGSPLVTPYFVHTPQLPEAAGRRATEAEERDPLADPNPYMQEWDQLTADQRRQMTSVPLACNGWLFGDAHYSDEATCTINCRAYRRREIVIWGDTVKLRYGRAPADAPYLWKRAAAYGATLGSLFGGLRMDNAHSTPLAVAIHCLSAARVVRPDLWVAAEWFSGDEHADAVGACALGASALVREAVSAGSAHDLARLCYENGRRCTAAHDHCDDQPLALAPGQLEIARHLQFDVGAADDYDDGDDRVRLAQPVVPGALFCDLTHDNETCMERRHHPFHALATAALVAISVGGALGSVRGADELVPKIRHLVAVRTPPTYRQDDLGAANRDRWPGFHGLRRTFNWLHRTLALHPAFARAAITETWAHQDLVCVTRRSAHSSFTLVARCAFHQAGQEDGPPGQAPPPFDLPYWRAEETEWQVVAGARLNVSIKSTSQSLEEGRQLAMLSRGDSKVLLLDEHLLHHGPAHCLDMVTSLDDRLLSCAQDARLFEGLSVDDPRWLCHFQRPDGPLTDRESAPFAVLSEDGRTVRFGSSFQPGSFVLLFHNRSPPSTVAAGAGATSMAEPPLWFPRAPTNVNSAGNTKSSAKGKAKEAQRPENDMLHLASRLSLTDLNRALYVCGEEERGRSGGQLDCYRLPGEPGPFCYAGLAGVGWALLARRATVARHLQEGPWLWSHPIERLTSQADDESPELRRFAMGAARLAQPLDKSDVDQFSWWIASLLAALDYQCRKLLAHDGTHRRSGGSGETAAVLPAFARKLLCRGTVQLFGRARGRQFGSLSAGLPHFAYGWARSWGRDTLMSLRGLLMRPGRWETCLRVLVRFARVVRHGLMPNLMAGGPGGDQPRYNARDATWWWLMAMRDFARLAPPAWANRLLRTPVWLRWADNAYDNNLQALLGANGDEDGIVGNGGGGGGVVAKRPPPVLRRELLVEDDENGRCEGPWTTLGGVVQLILQAHASSIRFRERDAGPGLDEYMQDAGFLICARLDPVTGLISGGNAQNAGTWMDKMGSSRAAGNAGQPATPRDGAAVELQALAYCTVQWLAGAHAVGQYQWPGVQCQGQLYSWRRWADTLRDNVDRLFFVPVDAPDDGLVFRRGIVKDSVGASAAYCDYQLRPNALVLLAEAPDLLAGEHAQQALAAIERWLIPMATGAMGVRTLDPDDWQYRPDYDQANESQDRSVARGFNYHQGPEWLWLYGYYLQAQRRINGRRPEPLLRAHRRHMFALDRVADNPWLGLPELTNGDGRPCYFSCPTQAWSYATIIDALCQTDSE